MTEKNINDLPQEMFIEILRFLDQKSLKTAMLTCKLWNSLIESTFRWSLALQCWDRWDTEEKINFILTTNRKFGSIYIRKGHVIGYEPIHEIFRKHGDCLVSIMWSHTDIDLGAFANLLHLVPNLKEAFIIGDSIVVGDLPLDQVLPDLKKLERLTISVRDPRVVKCFRKAKLKTMAIEEHREMVHSSLVDFLLVQDMLTSLTVEFIRLPESFLVEMGKLSVPIPFRLRKLLMQIRNGVVCANVLKFMKSQAENLEHLEIGDDIPSTVFECVSAFTKLDTLSVSLLHIPRKKGFYAKLKRNESVRTLELRDDIDGNVQFLGKFFKTFSNIRSLSLPDIDPDEINSVLVQAQSLSKLESLYVGKVDESSLSFVKFCNLKVLHIRYLVEKMDWNEFTKIHSRLAELTIEMFSSKSVLTSDDIYKISTNVVLRSLKLGRDFVANDRFFNVIRENCKSLEELHLHNSCIPRRLKYGMKIDVLLLCDDIKCPKTFRTTMWN